MESGKRSQFLTTAFTPIPIKEAHFLEKSWERSILCISLLATHFKQQQVSLVNQVTALEL